MSNNKNNDKNNKNNNKNFPDFKAQVNSRTVISEADPQERANRLQNPSSRPASTPQFKDQVRNHDQRLQGSPVKQRRSPGAVRWPARRQGTSVDRSAATIEPPTQPVLDAQVEQVEVPVAFLVTEDGDGNGIFSRNKLLLWLLFLVVLAAVIGGFCGSGACSSSKSEDDSSSSSIGSEELSPTNAPPVVSNTTDTHLEPTTNPTDAPAAVMLTHEPTYAPTKQPVIPIDRSVAIETFINNITISNREIYYYPPISEQPADAYPISPYYPEEWALQWLISDDPLKLSVITGADQFRVKQRYALLTLWFDPWFSSSKLWTNATGWVTAEDECTWHGITCTQTDLGNDVGVQNVITSIDLSSNNLHGNIPADLALLTFLDYLRLSFNSLSGSLPSWEGSWRSLETFLAADNQLTATLPESIGQWTSLKFFSVSRNSLTGTIPQSLANWNGIRRAWFYNNSFTGVIPHTLGRLTELEVFSIHTNALNGTIPESFGNWSRIREAYFYNNFLTGTMPSGLCGAANLTADCVVSCSCCATCCLPGRCA